jgi:VCBS repeat-containing protein
MFLWVILMQMATPLTVSAISGGSVGSAVTGTYGTLTIQSNGSYEYVADQSAAGHARCW